LDFVLFKEKEAKNIIIEPIHLMRQNANKEFTDKFRFVTIELPKFKKTLDTSTTVLDKLLYSLIHMSELTECPEEMNEGLLKNLYEAAQIDKLSNKEMETYYKSVLDYDDVRLAVDYAKREGLKKGRREGKREGIEIGKREGVEIGERRGVEIGEKRGVEIGEKRGVERERIRLVKSCYADNISIATIAKITGFTEEQVYNILDSDE
jgi:flagellar biosynthesis/type III secretory pathway protein FliH